MATVAPKRQKRVKRDPVRSGILHVRATFNNIIITVTDLKGNKLTSSSAGANGFKGSRKSTPYAASIVAEKALETARNLYGLESIEIRVNGPGPGRDPAVRAACSYMKENNLQVVMIVDVTSVPHNGCRAEKERRM